MNYKRKWWEKIGWQGLILTFTFLIACSIEVIIKNEINPLWAFGTGFSLCMFMLGEK